MVHRPGIQVFCVPNYLARQARQQKINGGILSFPPKQTRNRISDDLQEKVKAFYESDEVSKMCPGKKDCVKVTTKTGTREKVRKFSPICSLKMKQMKKMDFLHSVCLDQSGA